MTTRTSLPGGSRRCARPGCRAWAMRNATFCRSHRQGDDQTDARPAFSQFAEHVRQGRSAEAVDAAVELAVQLAAGNGRFDREIGALRLLLSRVVADEVLDRETGEVSRTLTRLVDTIIRAQRAQHDLALGEADQYVEMMLRIFAEAGTDAAP